MGMIENGYKSSGFHGGMDNERNGLVDVEIWQGNEMGLEVLDGVVGSKGLKGY